MLIFLAHCLCHEVSLLQDVTFIRRVIQIRVSMTLIDKDVASMAPTCCQETFSALA